MSNQGTVRLGDVATYINGYAFKPSDWSDNGLPIIRIQNLTGNDYQTNYYNKEYNPKYLVKKGDVLISWSASLGVFVWEKEDALLNQHIFKVVFDKIDVDKDYFCLTVEYLLKRMGSEVHGSTMKHITKPRFDNTLFPLPDKDTQKQISKKIITVDKLIHKYKVIAQKLDELVKSRFVEMFDNTQYPYVKAKEVCCYITKGTTPDANELFSEYAKDRVPFLKVYNLSFTGEVLFDQAPQFVSLDTHNDKLSRSKVYPNDVLMNIVGPPLGKFTLVTNDYPEWNINQAIAIFRAKENVNAYYLMQALMQPNVLRPFLNNAVGIRQLNLSLEQCRNLEIPLPPMNLQNQFADFVTKVEQQKATVKKSIEKLETLKKSLMQEYFG